MINMNTFVFILTDKTRELEIMIYRNECGFLGTQNILNDKQLVYYEIYDSLSDAVVRKNTIESWPEKKIKFLINFVNPLWVDWKEEIK